ncbi:hypothetical protein B0T24DRAFT_499269, partial [Lasiosphaeria ovina]
RQSNAERRQGRDECRQRLGIRIMPKEIRLKLRTKDPYAWKVLPGEEEFFSRIFSINLSNHSISTYRMLCREVGKSFEAVPSS